MGQPYKNNRIRDTIKQLLNLEMYQDKVPAEILEKIQLVIDVNPFQNETCDVIATATAINSTSATLYTTPTDRDFYLCSASISMIKDVSSTSTSSSLNATARGTAITLLAIPGITLTPQTSSNSIAFSPPILLDRGTIVNVGNSTNVANIITKSVITGFTQDNKIYDMGIGAQK